MLATERCFMALSKERMGEIALIFLKENWRRDGIKSLRPDLIRRDFKREEKDLSVPVAESLEFCRVIFTELVEEGFSNPPVRHLQ